MITRRTYTKNYLIAVFIVAVCSNFTYGMQGVRRVAHQHRRTALSKKVRRYSYRNDNGPFCGAQCYHRVMTAKSSDALEEALSKCCSRDRLTKELLYSSVCNGNPCACKALLSLWSCPKVDYEELINVAQRHFKVYPSTAYTDIIDQLKTADRIARDGR